MLTKDLLRLRRQAGEVRPQWLRADAKQAPFVAELVDLFRASLGQSQGDIRTQALELAQAHGVEPLLVRGLLKVCFDAATTEEKDDLDYPALRRAVFLASAQRLAQPGAPTPEAFRAEVLAQFVTSDEPEPASDSTAPSAPSAPSVPSAPPAVAAFLAAGTLYGDLPDESPLTAFPYEDAAALVSRYNVSMAQCLLVNARSVSVRLPASDRALLRRLWKALRFHGLIARLGAKEEGGITVELEGPLSLHMHSLKYGFSLAAFLPALLCEERWSLEARVSLTRGEEHLLRLEPRAELRTLRRSFHQYTPPELTLVFRSFAAKAEPKGWKVTQADDFVALPGEVACFPDVMFTDSGGKVAFVEIFHPWHGAALGARMEQIRRAPGTPLLLAVSRKAAKGVSPETFDRLEVEAPGHLLLFRETPVAADVVEAITVLVAARP